MSKWLEILNIKPKDERPQWCRKSGCPHFWEADDEGGRQCPLRLEITMSKESESGARVDQAMIDLLISDRINGMGGLSLLCNATRKAWGG